MCFFFFFQAEDGIRDADVTGVQTCALPISCLTDWTGEWRTCRKRLSAKRSRRSDAARSEERRVGKGVDLGGRRIIKKKKKQKKGTKNKKRNKKQKKKIA